jgi:urease accessory protein
MTTPAALLLLADARFPAGAHAHSFGVEAAHGLGDIADTPGLERFIRGRLQNTAFMEAAFVSSVVQRLADGIHPTELWTVLDAEYSARTASPVLRAASRSLGRQLLRAGERVWPSDHWATLRRSAPPAGPYQPLVLGLAAHVVGIGAQDAALCSLHHQVGATSTAAVRLLGLDPFDVAALGGRLASDLEQLAADAARAALGPIHDLPSTTSLLADVLAEHHATWEVRLFAS